MCIEYNIQVNVYHVSAQGVDEHIINVHYYYYYLLTYQSGSAFGSGCRHDGRWLFLGLAGGPLGSPVSAAVVADGQRTGWSAVLRVPSLLALPRLPVHQWHRVSG